MSHIATVKTEVKSVRALKDACRRLGLDQPKFGTHRLFDGQTAEGFAVRLPDWHYPVVFDLKHKKAHYDNYNGRWGNEKELDTFRQAYAVCAAKEKAMAQGFTVQEQQQQDGSIQLVCAK